MRNAFGALLLLFVCISDATIAFGAEDDGDEEPQFLPGLVARYETVGAKCVRRDEAVQFVWGDRSPDERLPPGDFSARWQGRILVLSPGKHRFYLYAAGNVALEVAGRGIVSGQSAAPQWFDSSAIDLEFGNHPLAITFQKTSPQARVGLYWSGPQFELEPVPGRLLVHDPAADADDAFERGAELWRALRCANCHRRGNETGLPGPSLAKLAGNASRAWLIEWLRRGDLLVDEEEGSSPLPVGEGDLVRMPQFALTQDEARAAADYLLSGARSSDVAKTPPAGDADRGRQLFITLGCLACHRVGELGASELFGGGDLSRVADKRPADFFARWLANPAEINAAHRMPVFRISEDKGTDLAAWLATLHGPDGGEAVASAESTSNADRGRRVVESLRCGACHALPGNRPAPASIALGTAKKDWRQTCLGRANRQKSRPGYALTQRHRDGLIAYLTKSQAAFAASPTDGRFVLRERNCLGCHARDSAEGIAPTLAAVVEREPDLAPLLPTLAPPGLTGVGDKLHDAALADAITLRNPPLRPWLAVRMPRFNLDEAELSGLTNYLTAIDRIPDRSRTQPKLDVKALSSAGSRLVTSTGFGCTSCHQIGHSLPASVALAAHGTDLTLAGKRLRRGWFDRWVRNPARIVPRMEMPAIQVPARGVLAENLDSQLAAVWHVLNVPGFEPPPSGPIRVARHSGDDSPPIVITDVVESEKRVVARPVMIGLKNRHNVLFDLSGNQLVGWWLGDTAHQQTRGKGWCWEPAGVHLLSAAQAIRPEIELFDGERSASPEALAGLSVADLDWFETAGDTAAFGYRLKFVDQRETIELQVQQRLSPDANAERGGFRREWEIDHVPARFTLRLRLTPAAENARAATSTNVAKEPMSLSLEVDSPTGASCPLHKDGSRGLSLPADKDGQRLRASVRYLTNLEPPPALVRAQAPAADAPAKLSIVPGYEATRLALPRSEMPTGLAWRDDGTLAFCSLKGGVWLVRDGDGDGLEDRLQLVADGLAAPYGIACHDEAIDVAAKYGIVRLSQLGADGKARRAEIVASGWGYTADYHDWTIGLPRDADGNYYIGLPCQQDDRSPVDAHLRGTVVKLRPRSPTVESPRRFALELISAGLRFPMGLAVERGGELFVTDNQGNYTPFNELNHLRRGARYGFINKLEARPGFQPPHEDPAIAIPHPWTRSVNGICFLYTPSDVQAKLKKGAGSERIDVDANKDRRPEVPAPLFQRNIFGPFEGHLIGCEFDTRRLIRMTLQKVGDTYQGAAYPFSVEPAAGEQTFEGPVVCAVSPRGDLYIGNLRDSGWGGGQNTGSIVRLRPNGPLPVGIAEVGAVRDGFAIDFTAPVDRDRAREVGSYSITSYRRIATPAYGGPDVDRENEAIEAIELSSDAHRARLRLKRLRPGFVYEFQLRNLAGGDQAFFPAEAYYTLRKGVVDR